MTLHDKLRALSAEMRAAIDRWEFTNYRSGHYDDYGAGEEYQAQRCVEVATAWADQLDALLAREEGQKRKRTDVEALQKYVDILRKRRASPEAIAAAERVLAEKVRPTTGTEG